MMSTEEHDEKCCCCRCKPEPEKVFKRPVDADATCDINTDNIIGSPIINVGTPADKYAHGSTDTVDLSILKGKEVVVELNGIPPYIQVQVPPNEEVREEAVPDPLPEPLVNVGRPQPPEPTEDDPPLEV